MPGSSARSKDVQVARPSQCPEQFRKDAVDLGRSSDLCLPKTSSTLLRAGAGGS